MTRTSGFGRRRASVACALAAITVACSDGPSGPQPSASLRLCSGAPWLAYRNEGAPWRRAPHDGDAYTFHATDRVEIARARFESPGQFLHVHQVTAAQAQATYRCPDAPPASLGAAVAEVLGLVDPAQAFVTYGEQQAGTARAAARMVGLHVRTGAYDLLAVRWPSGPLPVVVDRAVLRRAQSYQVGERVTIDLASTEAFPLERHTIRWTGPAAGTYVGYHTASGNQTLLALAGADDTTARSAPLPALPTARQLPTDMHEVRLGGDSRDVALYFRLPRDYEVVFGPPLATPVITTITTSPHLRVRADVAAQSEYGESAQLEVEHGSPDAPTVFMSVVASREFVGATSTWSLAIPDLRGVDGFQAAALARSGRFVWHVTAGSRPWTFTPITAVEGQVVRNAATVGVVP